MVNSAEPSMSTEPMVCEFFRLPLDSSMPIIFTGYFNGFNVEVRSADEASLLYHMGCFGKGTKSRSKPKSNQGPLIMRTRQYQKRNYWYKKFGGLKEGVESNHFLKELDELTSKIIKDSTNVTAKDVIDLVSSEEENEELSDSDIENEKDVVGSNDNTDTVVIVPNSDSEEEDYFAKLKPKCCLNKVKIDEKLVLTLQEAFFLTYGLGCLQIIRDDKLLTIQDCWDMFLETDLKFFNKYVVYHYYRSKGYIVKPGIKYGGDYLLYREGPGINHGDYIVVIKNDNNFDWISILGHVRMAVTTVKEIIIAEVSSSEDIHKPISPENIIDYRVREIILNRNIPVTINEDD